MCIRDRIKPFISWKPDPEALLCDVFTSKWTGKFYAFPPFSLISKVLVKIENDHAEGILIAPWWPTQPWFVKLVRMIFSCPVLLPRSVPTLLLPQNPAPIHLLLPKMTLMAFLVSGNHSNVMDFQNSLTHHYVLMERLCTKAIRIVHQTVVIILQWEACQCYLTTSWICNWVSYCTFPQRLKLLCIKYSKISAVLIHYVGRPLGWTASSGYQIHKRHL